MIALLRRTAVPSTKRPALSLFARYTDTTPFPSASRMFSFDSTTTNDSPAVSSSSSSEENNQVKPDVELVNARRRSDDLKAFREFQAVAEKMEWPAENIRQGLDEIDEDVFLSARGNNRSTFTKEESTKEDEELTQEELEKRDVEEDGDVEEEADDGEWDVDWAEQHPPDNRNTEKSFGVRIHDTITERDAVTLSLFVNELGRIQPRYLTGLSAKQQRKLAKTIKRARHMGVLPHTFRLPPDYAYMSPVQSDVPLRMMEEVFGKNDAKKKQASSKSNKPMSAR